MNMFYDECIKYAEYLVKVFHTIDPSADVKLEIPEPYFDEWKDNWEYPDPEVVYTGNDGEHVIESVKDIREITGKDVYTVRECTGIVILIEHYKSEMIELAKLSTCSVKYLEQLEKRVDTLAEELSHMAKNMIIV